MYVALSMRVLTPPPPHHTDQRGRALARGRQLAHELARGVLVRCKAALLARKDLLLGPLPPPKLRPLVV